jgi:mono/diheme cytochrome c family protein
MLPPIACLPKEFRAMRRKRSNHPLICGVELVLRERTRWPAVRAQDGKNPFAGDAQRGKGRRVAVSGETVRFATAWGREAAGGGPDLTRVTKETGNADGDLFRTISRGCAGDSDATQRRATQQGVGMTDDEIWQVITYIRSVQNKAVPCEKEMRRYGRELFFGSGACATCHMVQGKGGDWDRINRDGVGAIDGISGRVGAESEPAIGARADRGDEGIFRGVCDGDARRREWAEISGHDFE